MLTLSLIGGLLGLGFLIFVLTWLKAVKIAQYLSFVLIAIVGLIFFWESITGLLIYVASDLIEKVVEYWGAFLLIFSVVISGLVLYWRSK